MRAAHCKQSSNNFTAGAGSAEVRNQRQVKNASSQSHLSVQTAKNCPTAPPVRAPATATGNTSTATQPKSPQPFNGWTLTASPLPNAKKSGESKHSVHDNSAPTQTASPPAWATPAVHSPPWRTVNKSFWVTFHGAMASVSLMDTQLHTQETRTQPSTNGSRPTP